VATDAVARLGSNVSGLVLTGGASPRYTSAPDWPHGGTAADVEGVLAAVAADRATTLRGVAEAVCARPVSPQVIDWMWCMFLEMGPRGDDSLRDLAEVDLRKTLGALEVPVLLLHGREDAFVPFSGAEAAEQLCADGRLVEFPDSGHAPFLEDRDTYLRELLGFLDR
jgi:pimeloyl-[acyl-carrier protein] methyl ester esterase